MKGGDAVDPGGFVDIEKLTRYIELPETHRRILSGYHGAYSLGIGQDAKHGKRHVLILRVENQPDQAFPSEVQFDGETVPILVRGKFRAPRALATSG